jgi:hypothetical protein
MGNRVYDYLVDFIARFAAAVLTHPVMNESVLDIIVQGVDKLMEQPKLDEHIMKAGHTLSKSRDQMAHRAGKDFPKVAGAFVKGMVHIGNPGGDKSKGEENDEDSKTSAINDSDEGEALPPQSTVTATKMHEDDMQHHKKKSKWLHPMHMIRHAH